MSQSLRERACWKEAGDSKQKEDTGNGGVEGHCGYMGNRKSVCKGGRLCSTFTNSSLIGHLRVPGNIC